MERDAIIKDENRVYGRPRLISDCSMHYCPGCSHGVVHKLIAEVIDELHIEEKTIGISPVGCGVYAFKYINIDWLQSAHGRGPALASSVKKLWPNHLVFTYQGDGDLAGIGTAETIHALNRGDGIVLIFINNSIYGMTGGQMAPTTPLGMRTVTCPTGREPKLNGFPLKISELAAKLDGTCYVTRQSVHTVKAIQKAKAAIRHAFENSLSKKGASLIEIVATCNTGWKMTPIEANKHLEDEICKFYKIGTLKDI